MAEITGNLWEYNLAKLVVVDVTDDYRFLETPLPSSCYPILAQMMVPRHNLVSSLCSVPLVEGYLYDWHERPESDLGDWIVGVVDSAVLGMNGQ
ncbi:MAG: hypothetical protein HONBIEJF_01717 [Fimbriimonadaceae bacterium]|nr:hypothetical protein [Fimbriimonadaceae bacterium]